MHYCVATLYVVRHIKTASHSRWRCAAADARVQRARETAPHRAPNRRGIARPHSYRGRSSVVLPALVLRRDLLVLQQTLWHVLRDQPAGEARAEGG